MQADTTTVALVTGANRGIGLEVARHLAARGHAVVLTARDPAKAEAAAASLRGLSVVPTRLDVTDAQSVEEGAAGVVWAATLPDGDRFHDIHH